MENVRTNMTINKKSNGEETKGRHKRKVENIQRTENDLLPATEAAFLLAFAFIFVYDLCSAASNAKAVYVNERIN